MLDRIARACVRYRRRVIAGWLAAVALALGLGIIFAGPSNTSFSLPGSDSQRAFDLLAGADAGTDDRAAGQVVIGVGPAITDGLNNPAVTTVVRDLLDRIGAKVPAVQVKSPYAEQSFGQISPDGTVGYAELNLGAGTDAEIKERADAVAAEVAEVGAAGITLELSGEMFVSQAPGGMAEGIGMLLALGILVLAFGSVIAAGLPLLTALAGVGIGVGVVFLSGHILDIPSFAISLTAMLGIGVGIDYALLIVTRYRTGLSDGLTVEDAVARAMNTAGRSVVFAGATVAIAICGMLAQGFASGLSMIVAAGAGVLGVMAAALTLLPALLAVIGTRINKWHIGRRRIPVPQADSGPAYRWSRFVQRHPWSMAIGAICLLAVLALPALSLRLGFSDAGNRSETDTTRRAYDLLAQGYGDGANGTLLLVAPVRPGSSDLAVLDNVGVAIGGTSGVSSVSPAFAVGDGSAAIVRVTPTTGPQDAATTELVHHLREVVIPDSLANQDSAGLTVAVAGASAGSVDYADRTLRTLPWMLLGVLGASFLLLALAFRSLVVPLKAIVMNLLSMGAAFGVLVAVFQWGWGLDLIGVGKTGPVEAWVPMMLFAIAYGLSMDYEVFLLSRVREEFLRTGDSSRSVADGVAKTAKVITAAAAIMVCVFASFVFFDDRGLKTMGLGLAAAVLVDATVVRMVLVPAVMQLLGDRNWYWPRSLGRLPHFDVEPATPSEARVLTTV